MLWILVVQLVRDHAIEKRIIQIYWRSAPRVFLFLHKWQFFRLEMDTHSKHVAKINQPDIIIRLCSFFVLIIICFYRNILVQKLSILHWPTVRYAIFNFQNFEFQVALRTRPTERCKWLLKYALNNPKTLVDLLTNHEHRISTTFAIAEWVEQAG